jgi:uncharacterized membrane protein YfcA
LSEPERERRPGPALALLGLPMGVLAALCGIGGGLFAVPLLHFGWRAPLRAAVASALVLVLAATGASTLAELAREESLLDPPLVLALCATGVLGTRLGFALARRLSGRALRVVFALVLPLAALKLALPAGAVPDVGAPLAARDWPLVLGAGLGAGIVAPLLGVGGGLVAVPALALGTPLGFLPARAASLAMSAVNAGLGLWLYRRTGLVRWRAGLWLALGAVPGGVLGVALVHQPGLARVARWTLAAILVLVAARFALDALRGRAAGPQA